MRPAVGRTPRPSLEPPFSRLSARLPGGSGAPVATVPPAREEAAAERTTGKEENVGHGMRRRVLLRPALVLAALGAALSGCGLPEHGYGRPGGYSYGSPGYHRSHYRGESHKRASSQTRTENWSQERLRQHWLNQAPRSR